MGHNNREIEVKLVVSGGGASYDKISSDVRKIFAEHIVRVISGVSRDVYWHTPKSGRANFLRLRTLETNGRGQVTAKTVDRGDNFDRVEIDLRVDDVKQADLLLREALGKPAGVVTKRYDVFVVEEGEDLEEPSANVAVYQVQGSRHIFIEVEGRTRRVVNDLCKRLSEGLSGVELRVSKTSLYELFVKKNRMKTVKYRPLGSRDGWTKKRR